EAASRPAWHAVRGIDGVPALHLLELAHLGQGQQRRLLSVRRSDLDVGGEVLGATVEQGVEVLGHRAHRGQREDADHDARDGQERPQLAPGQVANDLHESAVLLVSLGLPSSSTAPSSLLLLTTPGEVAEVTTWA